MIIASSLIITTGIPLLFWGLSGSRPGGYLISAMLGSWIVFDILRSR
jgi:hypothetical protein